MRRKRKCNHYCNGYCFYNGDTGEICDTDNNQYDGYCPKADDEKILNEYADFLENEFMKSLDNQDTK